MRRLIDWWTWIVHGEFGWLVDWWHVLYAEWDIELIGWRFQGLLLRKCWSEWREYYAYWGCFCHFRFGWTAVWNGHLNRERKAGSKCSSAFSRIFFVNILRIFYVFFRHELSPSSWRKNSSLVPVRLFFCCWAQRAFLKWRDSSLSSGCESQRPYRLWRRSAHTDCGGAALIQTVEAQRSYRLWRRSAHIDCGGAALIQTVEAQRLYRLWRRSAHTDCGGAALI